MTGAAAKITQAIRRDGPITLERYWAVALFDPEHGYYSQAEPFGRAGDFVTAPDISQMFGEIIGAWCVAAWRALGSPSPFVFVEIGPGRGTLAIDMIRTVLRLEPDFIKAAKVRLVETSDRLAALQLQALDRFDLPLRRVRRIEELEAMPTIIVGNELFDAAPIRQFVSHDGRWQERRVALAPDSRFVFVPHDLQGDPISAELARWPLPPEGGILELSPQRDALASTIGRRIASVGGAALFIDYGHAAPGYGDTLQALRRHAFADPLAQPGLVDITSHVDFSRLARILAASGLAVAPIAEQGAFLATLGLLDRAEALARRGGADEGRAIETATRRLAGSGEGEMGRLFKVLAAASQPMELPPFR
ncbi:class I SAM-dependent methyltransferase [Mangrovicella endophytica]|uniref:class I SAM-dependent methyltransferase n=1 Tax=Mangrovicella endophytica TaxID=2066697 RepID=UPI000C9DE839|nr:SAM-dependent methyltransferase [Mangrovicella endophytica]